MHKLSLVVTAAGMIGLATAPALAAAPPPRAAAFAASAAQTNAAEVQMGQLAQQRGATGRVRQFGATLVQDHSAADTALQGIAQQQNLTLPTQASFAQTLELRKLSGLTGQQFDKEFVKAEVRDHATAIAQFQQEAMHGKNADLKSYAQETLPVLRKHLAIAQSLSGGAR